MRQRSMFPSLCRIVAGIHEVEIAVPKLMIIVIEGLLFIELEI